MRARTMESDWGANRVVAMRREAGITPPLLRIAVADNCNPLYTAKRLFALSRRSLLVYMRISVARN